MSANDFSPSGTAFRRRAGLFFDFLYRYLSYHPKRKVAIVSAVYLGVVLLFGWQFNATVRDVVTDEFNQQQLVLAQTAAEQISHHFWMLKKELTLLSLSSEIQESDYATLARRMQIAFESLATEGASAIAFLDSSGDAVFVIDALGFRKERALPINAAVLSWARIKDNRGTFYISEVSPPAGDPDWKHMQMRMAIPVWKGVGRNAVPATATFSGVFVIVVNVTSVVQQFTDGIKSGKTGYAWVIDSNGIFLYHKERMLIGKNAFEARKEKKPTISFARINEIQKKMMLAGKEGTSWYESGWHRGVEGKIRKLIAYSPIVLDDAPEKRIWSVAVVAPISEVEEAIHNIQIRQFLFQFFIISIILLGAFSLISVMAKWSSSLKREVAVRTTELKKSEQKYRSLVENAEDIIFTLDREGKFLSINSYGCKFLGRTSDQIISHNIAEIFSWPTAEMLLTTIKEVFSIKQGRQVTHLISVNDRDFWFNTNFRRLIDEEGSIYAVLGISRDITQRKEMEQQSYYTEKLASMGTLAAGVAHEINNPLAIILGFTDMLIEQAPPGTETHNILNTIYAQGNKAKKVVDSLLSFARTKEHIEVNVDINRNIEEVFTVLSNSLLVSKISIQTMNLSNSLPPVKGDPDELQQVFFNIINNAVYAMKGGGTLSIATQAIDDGRRIEIRISDNGPGIRKEHRKRIFDPLFTTKKVGDGTGLGLSVSYGIITRHRGSLSFETRTKEESDAPGTTFIITLPTAPAPTAQTS
jgi:two-component system, NtrC family, sensor kinase